MKTSKNIKPSESKSLEFKRGYHVTVIGATGTGKTYFEKNMMIPSFRKMSRVIVYDSKQDNKDALPSTCEVLAFDKVQVVNALNTNKSICYQPQAEGSEDLREDFNDVCRIIMKSNNITIFVDELADVQDSYVMQPYHEALLRKGRSAGNTHVGCTQRPTAVLNGMIATQSIGGFIVFKIGNKDIEGSGKWIPNIDKVRYLDDYEFLYIDNAGFDYVRYEKLGSEKDGRTIDTGTTDRHGKTSPESSRPRTGEESRRIDSADKRNELLSETDSDQARDSNAKS